MSIREDEIFAFVGGDALTVEGTMDRFVSELHMARVIRNSGGKPGGLGAILLATSDRLRADPDFMAVINKACGLPSERTNG